jgi:hypothetical protein
MDPMVGDIVFNTRQQNKVNPKGKLEWAKIVEVKPDGRNVFLKTKRGPVEADGRNCVLIYRPMVSTLTTTSAMTTASCGLSTKST